MVPSYKLQCLQHTVAAMASWEKEENALWCSDGLARTSRSLYRLFGLTNNLRILPNKLFCLTNIKGQTKHCLTNIKGFSRKNKSKIKYPDCKSALKPVPHSSEVPIPSPPSNSALCKNASSSQSQSSSEVSDRKVFVEENEPNSPILIYQDMLNDLVRDLVLSKEKAELLGSQLKQWNLLETRTKITFYRQRQDELSSFFTTKNTRCFCNNISGLMQSLSYQHISDEWRLFIDASKSSFKAVLLHNGNTKPSVPLAYAVNMKESYESMNILLEAIKYSKYSWKICGDLKVISLLLGLQLGYTKHMCFVCLWDSRDDINHYTKTILAATRRPCSW